MVVINILVNKNGSINIFYLFAKKYFLFFIFFINRKSNNYGSN